MTKKTRQMIQMRIALAARLLESAGREVNHLGWPYFAHYCVGLAGQLRTLAGQLNSESPLPSQSPLCGLLLAQAETIADSIVQRLLVSGLTPGAIDQLNRSIRPVGGAKKQSRSAGSYRASKQSHQNKSTPEAA